LVAKESGNTVAEAERIILSAHGQSMSGSEQGPSVSWVMRLVLGQQLDSLENGWHISSKITEKASAAELELTRGLEMKFFQHQIWYG
jgi:hypothetical protein